MSLSQQSIPMGTMSISAAAIALATTLVSMFIACALVAVIFPGLRVTHNWIAIFTEAPVGSAQAWIQGIASNAVAGVAAGGLFSLVYNTIASK